MAKSKYGHMPEPLDVIAKVRGDAGTYKVLGVDWTKDLVLLDRTCVPEWVPISKVALIPAPAPDSNL